MLLSSLFSWNHIHPVLVHFTTALFPVSVISDAVGRLTDRYSLTPAAWWMLFFGAAATPFTALAGWMWANEIKRLTDGDPASMLDVHQWLGNGPLARLVVRTGKEARYHLFCCRRGDRRGPDVPRLSWR